MANVGLHKFSNVAGKVPAPADMVQRELAINTADGRVYLKKQDGTIVLVNPPLTLPTISSVVLDLGPWPVSGETFVVTDANAVLGKKVVCSVSGDFTNGADVDELELDPLAVFAEVSTAGQIRFTVSTCDPYAYAMGEKTINYYLG